MRLAERKLCLTYIDYTQTNVRTRSRQIPYQTVTLPLSENVSGIVNMDRKQMMMMIIHGNCFTQER
jgi:hypothetical protein